MWIAFFQSFTCICWLGISPAITPYILYIVTPQKDKTARQMTSETDWGASVLTGGY